MFLLKIYLLVILLVTQGFIEIFCYISIKDKSGKYGQVMFISFKFEKDAHDIISRISAKIAQNWIFKIYFWTTSKKDSLNSKQFLSRILIKYSKIGIQNYSTKTNKWTIIGLS